jgi:hypothetical protein
VSAWGECLRRFTIYDKVLILIFVLSLPLSNPWVRGDGVGYYAFARALLIEHQLDFRRDWLQANTSFQMGRVDDSGRIRTEEFTPTGHLNNHFAVGPAMLWFPVLLAVHVGVLLYDGLGGQIAADGFSKPYLAAVGFATALYGFLALFLAFRMARKYVGEQWAFLAALGIWLGSSLPVYMYLNPSWAHAPSAFGVALFLWYWDRTRQARSWNQWLMLGALGGLMLDLYYLNLVLLVFPFADLLRFARSELRQSESGSISPAMYNGAGFTAAAFVAFLPTLITKKIIYGSYLNFGYVERWFWNSPALLKVCFSSEHGLFTWTPILIAAVAGLFLLWRYDRLLAACSILAFAMFLYLLGCYQDWHGISSFGSRFFVSLTALFVVGLAAVFDFLAHRLRERNAWALAASLTAIFAVWNAGLMFQWGTHLISSRGPISWRAAAHNQVAVVPEEAAGVVKAYLTGRHALMNRIEEEDVEQLKSEMNAGEKR